MIKGILLVNRYGNVKVMITLDKEYKSIMALPIVLMDFVNKIAMTNDFSYNTTTDTTMYDKPPVVTIPESAIVGE